MSENTDHARSEESPSSVPTGQAPQPPAPTGQPAPPPAPTAQPVVPAAPQPFAPQQPQPTSEGQQPSQAPGQPQQPQPQQTPGDQPQPTFRENGAFSFFATPSDPDDDPAPMSWGFKIGWFVLGLIGGMLGLLMAWISTSTLSSKRRRQAVIWTWAGFAVQAVIFLVIVMSGGSFPFMPGGGSTAAQSAGSTSAFG